MAEHKPPPVAQQWPDGTIASVIYIIDKYSGVQSTFLGVTLIVSGSLSIVFNIVDLGYGNSNYDDCGTFGVVGHGFWCGIMAILLLYYLFVASTAGHTLRL